MPAFVPSRRPSFGFVLWLLPSWLAVAVPAAACLGFGVAAVVGAAPLFCVFGLLPGAFLAYLAFGVAVGVFTGNAAPGAKGVGNMARFLQRDVRHPRTDDV